VAGAALFSAAALWPYRFVMKVLEQLKTKYASRLSIEANTPVTNIQFNPEGSQSHPYLIQTPRGSVRASHVVHCTNGYASHLIPELRGRIFPKRGTMTVQDLGSEIMNQGDKVSWNLHQKPSYDERTESVINGSYYLQQNAHSGYFFFGGEAQTAITTLTPDDSNTFHIGVQHLQEKLLELFGVESKSNQRLISSWSGIMGFTSDALPLVGKLPQSGTMRERDGEWIAAGFNGGGMCLCWRTGEALAKLIYGQNDPEPFPPAFEVSLERLKERLTIDKSIRSMEYLLLR
jgi:glycine/D-amino acid oxidase-like deaminating enzyme